MDSFIVVGEKNEPEEVFMSWSVYSAIEETI
jgi:hypothetical protein